MDQNISGFNINSQTGALTPAPGSPFPTGAQSSAITIDASAHYVYVTNPDLNTISGFAVSSDGSLTPVSGSPFADSGLGAEGLTIDPRGKVLYVADAKSNSISLYVIDAGTGALTNIGSVAAGQSPVAIAINPEGRYLYALDQASSYISCYAIDGFTGLLSPLPNAPSFGASLLDSISIDPLGKRVYAVGGDVVAGYTLFGSNGRLKLLSGSPFGNVWEASSLAVDLSNSFLYVSNRTENDVSGFAIDKTTGSLQPLSGSPFHAGTSPASITIVNRFQ
jgi:YVTN family beta-propeller protein